MEAWLLNAIALVSFIVVVLSSDQVNSEYLLILNGYYSLSFRQSLLTGLANVSILSAKDELSDFLHIEIPPDTALLPALSEIPAVRYAVPQQRIRAKPLALSNNGTHFHARKLQGILPQQVTSLLRAPALWDLGYYGDGVKVAIMDTGLPSAHPHFRYVEERSDWTEEKTSDDGLGHGTFVAGIIASSKECLGFAPNAQLHIYKVFTSQQLSYTSWFLDAFNYAIMRGIQVVNLSIGGPDFTDRPFMDKVWELTANGAVLVSAIGNDGPLYGTLNNPADQSDVIGVGGIDFADQIAKFSSRGATTWELPGGYGRMKPDLVSYGWQVSGSGLHGGCRTLSGTSVASPVVAGALALLISTVEDGSRLNPGMLKQVLIASADRLTSAANMFEQGFGKLNLLRAAQYIQLYTPQASLSPPYLDMRECPYMWPYCTQPLFHTAAPLILNLTILNGMGVLGLIEAQPTWHPYSQESGHVLHVSVQYQREIWPWSGWLAVFVSINQDFEGIAAGELRLTISQPRPSTQSSDLVFPMRIKAIARPERKKRVLWDQFHNLRYPGGYFPRDSLKAKKDPLDWNADHIHTNFKLMYQHLRSEGFYVDVLGQPFTCFDADNYGALLLVDPEEDFFADEMDKLERDVGHGLGLVVFADWHNASVLEKINGTVLEGDFSVSGHKVHYASGARIATSDPAALTLSRLLRNQGTQTILGSKDTEHLEPDATVLALGGSGKVGVFGDSNCLDAAHLSRDCFWLLDALLDYVVEGHLAPALQRSLVPNAATRLCSLPSGYGPNFPRLSKVVAAIDAKGEKSAEKPLPPCRRLAPLPSAPLPNATAPVDFGAAFKLLRLDLYRAEEGGLPLPPRRVALAALSVEAPPPSLWRVYGTLAIQAIAGGGILEGAGRLSLLLIILFLIWKKVLPRRPGSIWRRLGRRLMRRLRPIDHVDVSSL